MADPRFVWLTEAIRRTFKWIHEESISDLFTTDPNAQAITAFFDEPRQATLAVYAVGGDTFETDGQRVLDQEDDDDEDDEGVRFQKLRHQRLHLTDGDVPSLPSATVRSVYIIKNVPEPLSAEECAEWASAPSNPLNVHTEVVATEAPGLQSFQATLMHVFLPLVEDVPQVAAQPHRREEPKPEEEQEEQDEAPQQVQQVQQISERDRGTRQLNGEVVGWIKRLNTHVTSFVNQLSAERTLPMPANPIPIGDSESDIKAAASNDDIVKDIDATVSLWQTEIQSALDQEPPKETPLGEIEYWKQKHSALSGLYEQINQPKVKLILRVAQEAECSAWQTISAKITDLVRKYAIAKDNVKFLGTLDRHFRTIHGVTAESGTLQPIIDTMGSMLMAIRMVWIISRYYCTEENMLGLLEKIAQLIATKVSQFVDHRTILSIPSDEALRKIDQGQQALLRWKSAYQHVQAEINASEREQHWSFDNKRLFETTDYMAERCTELKDIIGVLDYYNRLLGAQLKQVLTDTTGIDKLLKDVEKLKKPIEGISFDPFEKKAVHNWAMLYSNFTASVATMDNQVTNFIQKVFDDDLRSAESAFTLLQSFKKLHSRGGEKFDIKKLLQQKADKILQQYLNEIQRVEQIFTTNCEDPPLTKNQPPIAGAIHWSTSLYHRLKKPIMKFQEEDLLTSPTGKEVKRRYIEVARMMKDYATHQYEGWVAAVKANTSDHLTRNILEHTKDKDGNDVYTVNFRMELFQIIREAKYLDRLGFDIPDEALNVTLQDEAYHNYVESLKTMLASFNNELSMVVEPEREIMQGAIKKLKDVLKPGLKELNWFSLGIIDFIKKCNGEITEFRDKSREVRKHAETIQAVVTRIAQTQLMLDSGALTSGPELLELQQVADEIDRFRVEQLEPCVRGYHSIPQTLKNIEVLFDTSRGSKGATGKSPLLAHYYAFWEKRVCRALLKMVINSLTRFASLLGQVPKGTKRAKPPIFKVMVSLSSHEATYSPPEEEILSTMERILAGVIETTKSFPRWMNGTCIVYTEGDVQPKHEAQDLIFTFHKDIATSPHVLKLQAMIITNILQPQLSALLRHVKLFKRYKQVYGPEKQLSVDAQAKNKLHWTDYCSKFQLFQDMIADFSETQVFEFGFIRCDDQPLYNDLIRHLQDWISLEGKQLADMVHARLVKFDQRITKFDEELHRPCDDIDDLKYVLEVMDDAQTESLEMERQYREFEFIYDAMARFGITAEGTELAAQQRYKWGAVMTDVHQVDKQLAPRKLDFRKQTQKQVAQFSLEVKAALAEFRAKGPGRKGIDLDKGVTLKNEWRRTLDDRVLQRTKLAKAEKLFGLDVTLYPPIQALTEELVAVETVYQLYEDWMVHLRRWSKQLWVEVRIDDMEKIVDEKFKAAHKMNKTHGKVEPFGDVQLKIKNFRDSLGLLRKLRSDALKPRHWKELMKITQREFNHEHITLDDLVAMEVYKYEEEIDVVVIAAGREAGVERDINSIKEFWETKELILASYPPKGPPRVQVLTDTSDIQEAVDDNIMKIQSIANVKWVTPFIDDVRIWERKLAMINDVLQVWVVVQVKWQYLESIFKGSDDIANQLPKETQKFNDIDKRWVRIMAETAQQPNVDTACNIADRLAELKFIEEKLDECQKDLTNYLESKRCQFPRFFFISDDELLSILASSTARSVQEHMLKMFDNSKALLFKGNSDVVEGVTSQESEDLLFDTPLNVEGQPVEKWLMAVLQESRKTLRGMLKAAVFYYPKMDRLEFVRRHHGMLTLAGCKIWWTFQIEDAFAKVKKGKKNAVKELSTKLSTQLHELVQEMDKDLDRLVRKKINTLIIVDVHGRDIVDRFVRDSVLDAREFEWESQLRFYWDKPQDTCVIRQCTGTFNYGYEFMGLNGRLVITPLTDRCFMTLTQALTFYLGGAPGGPAGTGKTESVKDLAKAMSLHCVVFNCGEGLDYKAMATIFSGLSQAGSWGCFDEFNRIELPVLSVVSEQLRSIQSALKNQQTRFVFSDKEITLDPNVGVFITMNPGYAGRVELPDNLKALFRPVVMVVPDMELIAENMLFSEGFSTARELAKKMVTLYSLARGQLSKQHHYDWGLRALKAVLVMAGQLKRGADLEENAVLMRALRDMNAPKFVAEDEPLFKGLIGDLFPGLDPTRVPQENLARAATKVLKEGNKMIESRQIDKVVQLYETMQTRHTTMVVGPTGGGKSVVINTLRAAQDELRLPTKLFLINPKAQPTSSLYGVLDPMTRNWTDGIFSNIFRNINRPSGKEGAERERKYVVFDGDVDAKWVEDLNSVMDDNKLLTLPNGERIRLHPTCSILFEVGDLQYASPATVSRVGMVFLDPANLGWQPFMHSWCAGRNKDESDVVRELVDKYLKQLIAFIFDGMNEDAVEKPLRLSIEVSALNLVRQLGTMLQTIVTPKVGIPEPKALESIFIFCCVWSFGALVASDADRVRFDRFLKKISNWQVQDNGEDLSRFISAGTLPEQQTMYEYFFDMDDHRWKPWSTLIKPFERPADNKFSSILVSTVDTERGMWLLDKIVLNRTPVLFIGESGTAKTVTIQTYLKELKRREKVEGEDGEIQLEEMLVEMNFSSRTSSLDAQRTLEDNVEKRTTTVLGPPAKKRLLVFVDDVNMPRVDLYGTQQPIAFLKFLIEHTAWYDRKDLICKQVRDTQFLAAMAPPGGGRSALDPRFISLFTVFNITFPSQHSLRTIYTQILADRYTSVSEELGGIVPKMTDMTLNLYRTIVETMPATPAKFHYIFNLRDLSRVYEGLCRATPDKFPDIPSVVRLWRNEATRVFVDRMGDIDDKRTVTGLMERLIRDTFPTAAEHACAEPILFGDFGDFEPDSEKQRLHLYEDFGREYAMPRALLEGIMEELNTPVVKMDLVMFDMAIDHLLRIIRVLSTPRGHCLLVGVGGSGKQSLTRLAAVACQMGIFEIVLSRGYGEESFREDLKKLFTRCGVDREELVFLFTDSHVKQEGFLELINNMLASGTVPALFPEEEKEPLYAAVMDEITALDLAPSKDNKWNAFVSRCRDNLHVVLSMTPSGDALRTRCRNFPSLINNTTIDWFTKWPEQALHAVGAKVLAQEELPNYLRDAITDHAVHIHVTSDELSQKYHRQLKRANYVTPKNFLAFLSMYAKLLDTKRQNVDEVVQKLSTGLERLQTASQDVAVMSKDLAEKKVILAAKTKANDEMLKETKELKEQNEASAKEATETEEVLNVRSEEINKETEDAEKLLEEAEPAMKAAIAAVSELDSASINELKSFAKPAATVVAVVEMVCHVWPKNDKVSWDAGKIILGQGGFMNQVRNFPFDTLKDSKITAVKRVIDAAKLSGGPEAANIVARASTAAAALFRWMLALLMYWDTFKVVQPKRLRVAKLKAEQDRMERRLMEIKEKIEYLQETVRSLQQRLEAGMAEAAKLAKETEVMERRLNAATRLINGFTSERQRWQVERAELGESRMRLVGDCLVGGAFMSYLGAFTYAFRTEAIETHWLPDLLEKSIPLTNHFRIQTLMTTEVEMSQWASDGLPTDDLSVQNGVLTEQSTQPNDAKAKKNAKVRFPLCVDPQMQAVTWIKRKHADNPRFEVGTFSDPDFLKRLEFCIQYGNPFLFENVDEFIDPIIDTVLDPQFREESGQRLIRLGDKEIAWDDNFKLYLCTKLANPNYPAEVFGKMLVINYSVTQDGLESQLLNYVVASERADLQKQSEELVQTMAENKAQLKQLEDSLIRELTLATGNILDNDELIETLESTKSSASDVTIKLAQAEETAKSTEESRQAYRPVAGRGAILFFAIAQLSAVNSMYEYSLGAFLQDVFKVSLEKSDPAFEIDARLHNIMEHLTYNVYRYVCMGIFERHKLMYSLLLTVRLLAGVDRMPPEELDFFLRGCVLASKDFPPNPTAFLTERQWNDVCKLATSLEVFSTLTDSVKEAPEEWAEWSQLDRPEEAMATGLPGTFSGKTSPMQRMCLLRCFRSDRVYNAVVSFIAGEKAMGEKFTVPPILRYLDVYKQSSSLSPIVCVVSPGANPTDEIVKLAEKLDMGGNKLRSISLGQGQEEEAMHMVEAGAVRGHWVLLQNCHLLVTWMKELEKVVEKRDQTPPHQDFRLWLTTEPSPQFPLGILQKSLKVVNEPPNGLKMNMKSTFAKISEEQLEECPHWAYRPLVYTLAFFHAVVQERRKYGKIGWNVVYDFNETDAAISMRLIDTYLAKAERNGDPIPWPTLRYLVGEAMYGGRVTDSFDRRIVNTYLDEYLGDFLFDTYQPFHFFANAHVDYCLPPGSNDPTKSVTRDVMAQFIDELPLENAPDVFGLHPNAETGYLRSMAEDMWANLIELMPRSMVEGAHGGSQEDVLLRLAEEVLGQIPAPFDRKLIMKQQLEKARAVKNDSLQPVQVVLMQELERWNKLVNVMVATIKELQKALAGIVGMSAELDDLAGSLQNGQLPAVWRKLAPATRKNLGRWLVHFKQRHAQFAKWIEEGQPVVIWLAGLMIPESYISALVQTTCRKYVWPLDKSTVFTRVTRHVNADEIKEPLADGAYIGGLFLEGARWDSKAMALCPQEKKVLIYELPVLEIVPLEVSKLKRVGTFRTPLYVTRDRRNAAGVGLVMETDLSCERHTSHWILESVALILNSDD